METMTHHLTNELMLLKLISDHDFSWLQWSEKFSLYGCMLAFPYLLPLILVLSQRMDQLLPQWHASLSQVLLCLLLQAECFPILQPLLTSNNFWNFLHLSSSLSTLQFVHALLKIWCPKPNMIPQVSSNQEYNETAPSQEDWISILLSHVMLTASNHVTLLAYSELVVI